MAHGHFAQASYLAAAIVLSAAGCKSHRTPAPDASTQSVQRVQIEAGSAVDWKTACALGREIGVTSTGSVHEFETLMFSPLGYYECEGDLILERTADGGGTAANFYARGWKDGAGLFRLIAGVRPSRRDIFARVLAMDDHLTRRLTGQAVPANLKHVMQAGGEAEVTVAGWKLKAKRDHGNGMAVITYQLTLSK